MSHWSDISVILLTLLLLAAIGSAAGLSTVVTCADARVEALLPALTQAFNTLAGDSIRVKVQFTDPQQRLADLGKLPLEIILQQPRQLAPGRQVISLLCCDADGHRSMQHLSVDTKFYGTVASPDEMLKRGEKITAENTCIQEIELSSIHLRSAVLHPERLIGMEVVRYLSADSPIRWDQVKPISLVKKGDGVEIVIDRSAFAIKASAVALEAGSLGEEIWVRLENNGKRMRAVVVDADHVTLE